MTGGNVYIKTLRCYDWSLESVALDGDGDARSLGPRERHVAQVLHAPESDHCLTFHFIVLHHHIDPFSLAFNGSTLLDRINVYYMCSQGATYYSDPHDENVRRLTISSIMSRFTGLSAFQTSSDITALCVL